MFEIKNFKIVNNEKVPFIKARFTAKFKALELNELTIMVSKSGDLYVAEPSRPYETRDGEKKYARYYFIDRGLKDQIADKAIGLLHAQDVQTAKETFDTDDTIPF